MRVLFFLLSLSLWAAPQSKKIETYLVQESAFTQPIQLIGTLKAYREAVLTANTSGILTHIFVEEGTQVKKGQILAELDAENRTILLNKKKRLERVKKLYKLGDVSLKDLEEAQNDLAAVQIQFKSPFNGQCGLFRAELGSHIQTGSIVVAVYDTSSFSVYFSVPESMISELKIGQELKIKNQTASLTSFENRLDSKNHLAYAKAKLDKCPGCIIGSKVPVELSLKADQKIIAVPSESVFLKNASSYVYKVVNQKAVLTPVKTGERARKQIAILEGLKAGDVVILRGQSRINHDDPVY